MFDISTAQSAIATVLNNLSYQIFVYLGWVLGIFAALLGLYMGIRWVVHYIAGRGGTQLLGGNDALFWASYNRDLHDFKERMDAYDDMLESRHKAGRYGNEDIYRLRKEEIDNF